MAAKFTFHEEVLALAITDDITSKRLVLLLRDYAFPKDEQATVAQAALSFTAEWGVAPKDHIYGLIEDEHHSYLRDLNELAKHVHRDYVMARLDQFMREGAIRRHALKALDAINMGDWDAAETAFSSYGKVRSDTFDPGIRLRGDALREIMTEDPDTMVFRTGVAALDNARIGPAPKSLFTFMAPAKRGKSWALMHIGKTNVRDRRTVLHITLEMNKRQCARRYIQSVLSLTKRQVEDGVPISTIQVDNLGRFQGIGNERVQRPKLDVTLYDRANALFSRYNLYIKEFPTGTLTIPDLRAYLDTMEDIEHVVPDVVILDYADLMKLDARNLRVETGIIVREFRGICMERGIAGVTASQSNRQSADAKWVTDTHASEDYSKIMTSDTVVTYSQTPAEKQLNLARLFVSNARDEADKWGLLLSQSYAMGQFCLDSVRLDNDEVYWNMLQGPAAPEAEVGV